MTHDVAMKNDAAQRSETPLQTKVAGLESGREPIKAFDLTQFFAVSSFLCIGVLASLSVAIEFRALTQHSLKRDAVVMQEFTQSMGDTMGLEFELTRTLRGSEPTAVTEFFTRVAEFPAVIRANIYAPDQTVIWSNNSALIGQRFTDNVHLQRAVAGELVFKLSDRTSKSKKEYEYFPENITKFAEFYFPIWNLERNRIIAVVEIYENSEVLLQAVKDGMWFIWMSALVGGGLLYGLLVWIIRRASFVMQAQQEQLVESETMAAIGEMASAVAHGIRNPRNWPWRIRPRIPS
jgi:hypothetical protein